MCTLIVGHRIDAETPLLVGANRDESFHRPSSPPSIHDDGPFAVLAPRDDLAGGTWLGLNSAGVFAALTNRFGCSNARDRHSRGELVFRALEYEAAARAAEAIAEINPLDYNGFHLAVADGETAHVIVSDGELLAGAPLQPGFAVLTERSFGAADNARKRRLRNELTKRRDSGDVEVDELRELLTRCSGGSLDAVCVDLDEIDYGTRSSTILRRDASETTFLHADGPPCEVEYEDLSELVAELEG